MNKIVQIGCEFYSHPLLLFSLGSLTPPVDVFAGTCGGLYYFPQFFSGVYFPTPLI